ncbi:N-formylglutamate amidohydrolase [Candidatus Puniceispirillum sp.]|uniref:N-formylglutamate amidohydrolase n=1 Tax=Candidatus Puniceispirillum sp. TaxID=2026719 RepID=UPI001ECE7ED6|nr:N-formylglutamate amidohydrolase [Candidatus Puniceispirillum sp.]MBT6565303.1 N-formylglutamate amidohydrolase [Candidatus Puniceispirillum sp.]
MDALSTSPDIATLPTSQGTASATDMQDVMPQDVMPQDVTPVMVDGAALALDFSRTPEAASCHTDDANFVAVSKRHSTPAHTRAVVVSCPHAGRLYPAEFIATSALELAALRDLEDFAVDRLIEGMMAHNITTITNHVGRAFLDVNRPIDALDKIMFADTIDAATPSRQVKAGYGLLPRLNAARMPIHNVALSHDEVRRRLDMVHTPYHQMLAETLETALTFHGHYLLLDIHSMPQTDQLGRPLADFVLGDCLGTTIDPKLGSQISEFIAESGFSVAWNKPYAGGHITREYGRINSPRQSVQIEINRALYMTSTPVSGNPAQSHMTLEADGAARVAHMLGALGAMLADMLDNNR